ncbi:CRISPR-associated endonuclease Cas1 [Nitrosotalea sinensis]|uniref:CRISPR-associated endonuclease Cas1 n=1 Tax=Nitrosotalea sinensis TaxID=1499975 RepID=A0A2H1EIW6_9ARCH|nr:CRISPR-associated endonuclease Cas1 [Candidatus Nitrosotalea sinensis]SHO47084.1 CRISPR-associated endonuclease Cas1 [Candidatus Nitrosotalea sinensis]
MTLRGKRNHYNVKFLKGYGFSIKVKDSKIVLKNCSDPFKEPEIEEWYVNNMPYEKIVLSGKGYVSTEALALLSEHNRNLILLDVYGRPITYLNPVVESLTNTNYRIGQYDTFRDESKRDYLSRQIVKAKLDSQINFLKSTNRSEFDGSISKLESLKNQIEYDTPILLEKNSATIYFKEYQKLIPKRFEFHSRNNVSLTTSKRNATDVINALLNYGYTVLAGEISKFINGMGLDAYYGFYHKNQSGFQMLVYDIMEPFRWLVDYSVWKIAESDAKGYRINLKDYARTREGLVVMDYSLVKRFLELLDRTFRKERRYDFSRGKKTLDGLKSVQEITIAKIAVSHLADFCIGEKSIFSI